MAQTCTIGHVAKVTGVAAKTIRYYEKIGVLPAPSRTRSGYRRYDLPAVQRVRFVGRARALHLPLRRLRELTRTPDGVRHSPFRPRLLALVREELWVVRRQMVNLQSLQAELEQVLRRPLAPARERRAKGCRCLETGIATGRPQRTRAAVESAGDSVPS